MMDGLVPISRIAGTTGLIVDGDWVESKDQDPEGDVRLVQLADVGVGDFLDRSNRFMTSEKARKLKCTFLQRGDILVARMPDPLGRACQFPGDKRDCVTVVDVCILRPDESIVDAAYVTHILNSNGVRKQLDKFIKGTTRQRISRTNLEQIRIPLPHLPEQRRIAAILDQADALRAKRREALVQLDSLTQSIFIEMFGDPVANPRGWAVKKLRDISTKILSGTTPNGGSQVYVSDGVLFLRSQNVWKNSLLLDDVAYIDEDTHSKMRKSSLKNKDILITKTGRINTENSSLGRAAIFTGKDNSANINGHVYLVRLNEGEMHKFVLYILTTDAYREYIRSVCVGGIDKRQINKEHLEEFPIISPPFDLQHRFAASLESIEKQKSVFRAQLDELEHMFSSLQHRAFRGEL